jgi:hypothetical protein
LQALYFQGVGRAITVFLDGRDQQIQKGSQPENRQSGPPFFGQFALQFVFYNQENFFAKSVTKGAGIKSQ